MHFGNQEHPHGFVEGVRPEGGSLSAPKAVLRGRRPSFREAIELAEERAEFPACYDPWERDEALAVCRVMAEIYMMHPRAVVKISGEEREAGMVAEVFAAVEAHHVRAVVEKVRGGALDSVKNRRAYLRAMLYNEVFEGEV